MVRPCRMLGPVVQRVAGDAQGRWQVGKVNVDEQPELARRFGIMSIPTVMVFKNGRPARAGCGRTDTAKAGRDAAKRAVTPWPCGRLQGGQNVLRPPGPAAGKGKTNEAPSETGMQAHAFWRPLQPRVLPLASAITLRWAVRWAPAPSPQTPRPRHCTAA